MFYAPELWHAARSAFAATQKSSGPRVSGLRILGFRAFKAWDFSRVCCFSVLDCGFMTLAFGLRV